MSWLLLGLIPPFIWSINCIVDEFMIQRYFMKDGVLFLVLASCISFFAGLFVFAIHPAALDVTFSKALVLCGLGVLLTLSYITYVTALQRDSVTVVVGLFQLTPLIVFLLGWLFLNETVTAARFAGSLLIVAASVGIVWDFESHTIQWGILGLVGLAAFGGALHTIGVRYQTQGMHWLTITAWMLLGPGIVSWGALAVFKPWRRKFKIILYNIGPKVMALFIIQTFLEFAGLALFVKVVEKVPAAGVAQALEGTMPFYVLVLSYLLGRRYPELYRNVRSRRMVLWRTGCFVVLFAGLFILGDGQQFL